MGANKKSPLEEEFEKYFSSEKGAWMNAWSPTWEDTSPSVAVSFDFPGEDSPEESDTSAAIDPEEPK